MNILLVVSFAISCLGIVGLVIWLGLFLHSRVGASLKWWAFGMLVFVVFQGILRLPWVLALPQLEVFREWVKDPLNQWIWIVFLCVTAGVFEEGGRWIGYRTLFKAEDRVWKNALMFGAGHGGIEALGVALLQLSAVANYLLLQWVDPALLRIPPEAAASALKQFEGLQGWEPLLGLWERVGSVTVHLALSVMVLQAFRRHVGWLPFAMLFHALTNLAVVACMVQLQKKGWDQAAKIVPEIVVTLFALAAFWVIKRFRERGEMS
ncbi:MAG: YhfC family glutamic-type intramembrane protease [Verrucomicrobiales bacterium]